jgi:hypothetical protein
MAKPIKWRVQSVPTGMYRSFQKRGWPQADYPSGTVAAAIYCTGPDDYDSRRVATGDHAPLTVRVADYSVTPWQWRRLKGDFKTLQEAKAAFERFLATPGGAALMPKEAK